MPDHPFDAAIALAPAADGLFDGATHPAWANMVGPFGGVTAATLLNAVCRHPQRLGEPLSLTVNFAGPIAEGPFRIAATPVRTNRSTQHWSIMLQQGDEVATTATAVFALRRDAWSSSERGAPQAPPADRVAVQAPPAFVTWPGRYEMRFVAGAWPDFDKGTPQDDSCTAMWVRDEPPRPLDALALTAICDVFYPRVFRRIARFAPAGTVSITTFFHADAIALAAQGARPVLAQARAQRFVSGFHDQIADVWGDDGSLLASSHQIVYYKA
jgi:hypothetical protein